VSALAVASIAAALLAFAGASCAGASTPQHPLREYPGTDPASATGTQVKQLAVPLISTPHAALARCRESKLLRAICPGRVPSSVDSGGYYLEDGCANAPHITIASSRCTLPGWSYETAARALGSAGAAQHLTAWDGREWVTPGYAPLTPPPYFVHVLIEAARNTQPPLIEPRSSTPVHNPTDALLRPTRADAVSLGQVNWYGHHGQLILEPQTAGEVAGHLIFSFASDGVHYAVTLHAWASKIRLTTHRTSRVIYAPQPGPALPHVIATLKAIVGSTLAR
jgi:hypothetical protein